MKTLAAASAAAFLCLNAQVAQAQAFGSPDRAVPLTSLGRGWEADQGEARPLVDRGAPSSRAFAESDDGRHAPGVMTGDGPRRFDALGPRAFGSFGLPYTSTRVEHGSVPAPGATDESSLSTTYPYSAVGRLEYKVDEGVWGLCTASVILRGVIVTAAHCIQEFGSGTDRFTDFRFVPGHHGAEGATAAQKAPFGIWAPFRLARPGSWMDGTDTGCGFARDNDLAVMAIEKDANGRFIGEVVGQLYYAWNNYSFVVSDKTGHLAAAAVTTLGYPGFLDQGRIMQRTDGPTYLTTECDALQLWQGSNFTGGSSGGPWVVNFSSRDAILSGAEVPADEALIAVIGVTSWGSDPNGPKDNYSSRFGQNSRYPEADYGGFGAGNIGSLVTALCSSPARDGGTLASQGYCS